MALLIAGVSNVFPSPFAPNFRTSYSRSAESVTGVVAPVTGRATANAPTQAAPIDFTKFLLPAFSLTQASVAMSPHKTISLRQLHQIRSKRLDRNNSSIHTSRLRPAAGQHFLLRSAKSTRAQIQLYLLRRRGHIQHHQYGLIPTPPQIRQHFVVLLI